MVVLQALLDRHAMLRLRVEDDGAGDWSLNVPEAGSVDAAAACRRSTCCPTRRWSAARSRLNPAAGVMLSALWVASTGQLALIIHHLAVDGVSWRILLEDLNIAWAQHHSGQPVALPRPGTSFAAVGALLAEHAQPPGRSSSWPTPGDRCGHSGGATRSPTRTRYLCHRRAPVGVAGCRDHPPATRRGTGGVPRRGARHPADRIRPGVHGILGYPRHPDRHRCRGPRPHEDVLRRRPIAHGGLVHHQIPGGIDRRWTATGRR